MITQQKNSYLRTFFSDFIVSTISFLTLLVIGTICSIIVTGSREEGMVYGLFGGFTLGLIAFYFLRGQFNFSWTILQLILNAGLTIVEFYGFSYLFNDTAISNVSYGYILILIAIPTLISLNKQFLDYLTKKINADRREKQPMQIL